MAKLIVFVHGLGANDDNWWGSTESLLKEKYKNDFNVDIWFYNYETEKVSGLINKIKLAFGMGTNLADFSGLGGLLLSELEGYVSTSNSQYDEIKFFAHSMGGIVVASCLWKMKIRNSDFYKKVSSVVLCGTPLGGSKVAARVDSVLPWKTSKHTKLLKYNNKSLKEITNNLSNVVSLSYEEDKPILLFFEIVHDEVVQSDSEKFAHYNRDDIEPLIEEMRGGHVSAVQNLSDDHPNFKKIIKWIEHNEIEKKIPKDEIEKFRQFISKRSFSTKIALLTTKLTDMYLEYLNDNDKKRAYIDLSVHARRTYLHKRSDKNLAITDFKRIVKVVDNTRNCVFEIKNGFLKESKYGDDEEISKIISLLEDDNRAETVDRFSNIVLNLGYRINGGQKLFKPTYEIETYENDKYKGFNIKCLVSNKAIGDEIEFLASMTLPVTIFDFPDEKDLFSFPIIAYDRKYIIQEEIYGNNSPKLEPNEVSGLNDEYKDKDRSLYYNRYIFSSVNDKKFKTVKISYSIK